MNSIEKKDNAFERLQDLENEKKAFVKNWMLLGLFGVHRIKKGKKITGYMYLITFIFEVYLFSNIIINSFNYFEYNNVNGVNIFIDIGILLILSLVSSIFWIVDFFIFTTPIDKEIKELRDKEIVNCLSKKSNYNK